ncbi:MAG: histidine ammonia-lyase [Lishizhenia sp.]
MKTFTLNNQHYSIEDVFSIIENNTEVVLGETAKVAILNCRAYLDKKIAKGGEIIYGINTGFGSLCDTVISNDNLEQLQVNLVRSHACGTGNEVDQEVVKIMLLLKAMGLSHGNSGAQLDTVERLLYFFNNNIIPQVFEQGSLGASGDLAPLAHIAMACIGEGKVYHNNQLKDTKVVFEELNLNAIQLKSKEGLALLNGTQFMSAFASYAVFNAKNIIEKAVMVASIAIDGYDGRKEAFWSPVHEIRNQVGQIEIAQRINNWLTGSEIFNQEKAHVQDPYTFRCTPQVLGASLDTINYAEQIVTREINAVTDNPTIFIEDDKVVSAGNFHGQPMALILDFLAIALAEVASLSERRTYKLISGTRGLPAFLVANPGINSGLMIAQYTAASIVSQNKQLCTPASVDTIDSSNGQEDHVSMGANAATKLYRVIENVYQVLGIEMLTAAQALNLRGYERSSDKIKEVLENYRREVPFIENDRYLSEDLRNSKEFIKRK